MSSSTSASISSPSKGSAGAASAIATATPPNSTKPASPVPVTVAKSASASGDGSATSSFLVSSYFLSGAVAGAASRTSVAPLERLKIIYQCQGNSKAYGGVGSALLKIWREEGVKGMFRGNGVNCIRIMPSVATSIIRAYMAVLMIQSAGIAQFSSAHTRCGSEIYFHIIPVSEHADARV